MLSPSSTGFLPSTKWHLKGKRPDSPKYLTIHHLKLATALAQPGLVEYLHKVFADELERGLTYPQEILPGENYSREMFEGYYLAGDVLVAVLGEVDKQTESGWQDGKECP
ncbi:hypothetical protein A0H81_10425 [Grifola frondosa]|uniref:Uncharacterized protein n=1 Tax=Grifola frondosa TaxID=5627 RepID=A0A1C7LZW9_GRIFR|nr:hypothetical protein A0H81_10425 [Grifola frondosa]